MNIKTITAGSMQDALKMVKQSFGSDAMILHTRQYKRGGLLGIGARNVIEITAGSRSEIQKYRKEREARNRQSPRRATPLGQMRERAGGTAVADPPAIQPSAGDLIRRTYAAARAELATRNTEAPSSDARPAPPTPPPQRTPDVLPDEPSEAAPERTAAAPRRAPAGRVDDSLADEMRTVRALVEKMMAQQDRNREVSDLPQPLYQQYQSLIAQEMAEELAEEIVTSVRKACSESDLSNKAAVEKHVREALTRLVPEDIDAATLKRPADGRPRTIALIGPTGVGKTTTLAKLAATFKLKQGKHVGLITLDTYRIAAVDQLRTYANIIGVPLHVAVNVNELESAMAKLRGCDVILIDTAGRSQRDDDRLSQLRTFLDAANPHEVHLVLSSTCSQKVMLEAAERFAAIRADRIIFTKLDEAVSFGVLFNVAKKVNKRLSYVTTGQEVPHHIEPGRAERLAHLVMGGDV